MFCSFAKTLHLWLGISLTCHYNFKIYITLGTPNYHWNNIPMNGRWFKKTLEYHWNIIGRNLVFYILHHVTTQHVKHDSFTIGKLVNGHLSLFNSLELLQTSQWNFELGLINSINGCVQKVGEPLVDETTHIVPLHCQQKDIIRTGLDKKKT